MVEIGEPVTGRARRRRSWSRRSRYREPSIESDERPSRPLFLAKSDPVGDPSSRLPATGILLAIRFERRRQLRILFGIRSERHRQLGFCSGSDLNAIVNWDPVRNFDLNATVNWDPVGDPT
jgi:hypothetical protein